MSILGSHLSSADRTIAVKLFLSVYLVSAFFFTPDRAFARFVFTTKAIAHYGTVFVDQVENEIGLEVSAGDTSTYGDHKYVCCPGFGLPFVALITYAPYARLVLPSLQSIGIDPLLELKLSQFVMALSTVVLFTAATVAVFYLCLRLLTVSRAKSVLFATLLYVGTPIAFYSLNITTGQNIIAMFLLLGTFFFLLLARSRQGNVCWLLSGLLAGLAVFTNLPALIAWPLFLSYLLIVKPRGYLLWPVGALLGTLPMVLVHILHFSSLVPPHSQNMQSVLVSMPLQSWLNLWSAFVEFSVGFRVGLLFYCPLLVVLVIAPHHKGLDGFPRRRFTLIATVVWIVGVSVLLQIALAGGLAHGTGWYILQGGGGPRYLLPIIPLMFISMAQLRLDSLWLRRSFSCLCFVSIAINLPGLFWTGGQTWFLNNLLLFLKNGFHSYMLEEFQALFLLMGLNVSRLSIFPSLGLLAVVLWWLWKGSELVGGLVSRAGATSPIQDTPKV